MCPSPHPTFIRQPHPAAETDRSDSEGAARPASRDTRTPPGRRQPRTTWRARILWIDDRRVPNALPRRFGKKGARLARDGTWPASATCMLVPIRIWIVGGRRRSRTIALATTRHVASGLMRCHRSSTCLVASAAAGAATRRPTRAHRFGAPMQALCAACSHAS
jgi:hypothetical protein